VRAAGVALDYLKRFTHADILLLKARSQYSPPHDQVITVELPPELDDHQASIYLKTGIHTFVGPLNARFCYLDSDVIAVSEFVDNIFQHQSGPITFAADQIDIDMFSRYAVHCRCNENRCSHLREAILCSFGIEVKRCDWTMWNGGVFLFDEDSADFLDEWHALSRQILSDHFWRTRDQGTLAATVWKFGYQNLPILPHAFNLIVDRFWGVSPDKRAGLLPSQFHVRSDYSLTGNGQLLRPFFLHFVNGGVNNPGWSNWDEVTALAESSEPNTLGDSARE